MTIDAVRRDVVVAPVSVTTGVRHLPPLTKQNGEGWGAIISARGPLNFTEPDAKGYVGGDWDGSPAGTEISTPCGGWPGEGEYTELLTIMKADSGGAAVDRTYIDYTTKSGNRYTLEISLGFIMCGKKVNDVDCTV